MIQRLFDVVIIGAGIVGAALARELSAYTVRVAILDKAAEIPSGASRANSAMIHAGYDDKPGTRKAHFCPRGNKRFHELHELLDFTLRECGSYVCAFDESEVHHLDTLLDQGKKNGVPGMEIISGDVLHRKEPHASREIHAALWAPSGAIVNNFEAVVAFMDNAQQNGAELFLETQVTELLCSEGKREILGVETTKGRFLAPIVINAAGVHAGEISHMAGDESVRIRPTRGEYFITDKTVGHLVKGFFFACPSAKGKGITVASTAEHNLLIGPTSTPQTDLDDTSTTMEGLEEVLEGARKLIPDIPPGSAITSFAGVRANTLSGDFNISVLRFPRGFVNAAGIKSPGFTSAPAIALHVVEMLREDLADRVTLAPKPHFVPERTHIPRFA